MVVRRGRPVHSIMLGADNVIMCVFLFHETFHQQRIIIILLQVGHFWSKLVMQFQNNEVFFNKSLAGFIILVITNMTLCNLNQLSHDSWP